MTDERVAEFATERRPCDGCKKVRLCQYLKAAHVPLYSWRCGDCRLSWIKEGKR